MSKYDPLTRFLADRKTAEVAMTFEEIERVIGTELPPSKQYPAWWSNNPSNNVMTRAWLAAGYRTERVDIGGEKLVFRKAPPGAGARVAAPVPRGGRSSSGGLLHRLHARLGGSVTVAEGVDLCAPVADGWDAEA